MIFATMMNYLLVFIAGMALAGCSTGSTLRTARILEKEQFEASAGVVANQWGVVSLVAIGAYGVTDDVEVEGRFEDRYVAVTPRMQLSRAEDLGVDCLTFFELGIGLDNYFQGGPGLMIGKRWGCFEPYASYRFRYEGVCAHYVKFGSRIYFPSFWEHPSDWFFTAEIGPAFYNGLAYIEGAASLGFKY